MADRPGAVSGPLVHSKPFLFSTEHRRGETRHCNLAAPRDPAKRTPRTHSPRDSHGASIGARSKALNARQHTASHPRARSSTRGRTPQHFHNTCST